MKVPFFDYAHARDDGKARLSVGLSLTARKLLPDEVVRGEPPLLASIVHLSRFLVASRITLDEAQARRVRA